MTEALLEFFAGTEEHWRVFFLSMLPVTELRAALPLGVLWGLTSGESLIWSLAGNFVPVIPLLLVLPTVFRFLARQKQFSWLVSRLVARNKAKEDQVRRYGIIGLTLLVAVPLPFTGIWTGCLVAAFLRLRFLPSLISITIGMVIAGTLVFLATSGVVALIDVVYGEYVAIALIILLIGAYVVSCRKK